MVKGTILTDVSHLQEQLKDGKKRLVESVGTA